MTLIGIDGGGTRTRGMLVDATGTLISTSEAGPSNLNQSDLKTVTASLRSVIESCLEQSDTPPLATCLGLAGASAPKVRDALIPILQELLDCPFELTTDAEIALDGAFAGDDGILLIAGTGSVCLGREKGKGLVRSGGWGGLVDDAGSANRIGQRAVFQSLREMDGRAPVSTLGPVIFEALGVRELGQILDRIYHPPLTPADFGRLAPVVCNLAKSGEPSADAIIEEAVTELEQLVRATAKQLPGSAHRVCFSGGLLEHNSIVSRRLRARLNDLTIETAVLPPVSGAVLWAAKLAEVEVDGAFVTHLMQRG